ncbi:hypothetical protein E2C01_094826 [Portunus trituberculatus]|uniref:Uncharacterized protein n=1 Tax=Portunus trituberculatus TaxID=210409 RepID=A0A5B7JY89_PORTR|nr:hypothetical protein [Portunus trituberculatus]
MASEDAVPHWEEFYLGSRRFQFVADGLGMPIDQVTLPSTHVTCCRGHREGRVGVNGVFM